MLRGDFENCVAPFSLMETFCVEYELWKSWLLLDLEEQPQKPMRKYLGIDCGVVWQLTALKCLIYESGKKYGKKKIVLRQFFQEGKVRLTYRVKIPKHSLHTDSNTVV